MAGVVAFGCSGMKTIRLTMAQALVRYLTAQRTVLDRRGVAAVCWRFCHFRPWQRDLPGRGAGAGPGQSFRPGADRTSSAWRWPRSPSPRRTGVGSSWSPPLRSAPARPTWSPRPAWRMPTACPCCCSPATPSPTVCPIRCFSRSSISAIPTTTVNDAFKAVTRYWDRIVRPEQIISSLPQAVAMMLDPGRLRPGLPRAAQDVQAEAL